LRQKFFAEIGLRRRRANAERGRETMTNSWTAEKDVMVVEYETRPVVVGVDGSEDALHAARWAAALAVRLGEPLHLVHAFSDVEEALLIVTAPQQADAGAYPRELGQSVLDRAADAIHADFPSLRVTRTLRHHGPREALIELSRQARLMVLACADVSAGGAVLVGSTTLAVATRAACPVIAWRGTTLAPNDRPVVVGIDQNRISLTALTTAFELADCLGVALTVVYAMSPRRLPGEIDIPMVVDWEAVEDEARQRLSERLAPIADRWPDVEVTHIAQIGSASRVILSQAQGAQLIVVGSRGRGGVASALLGSTGLNLLHHSPTPVVICPASRGEGKS
jgi:nucleotide-binding universal stress UspA family protein